jgi:hypothetical protein
VNSYWIVYVVAVAVALGALALVRMRRRGVDRSLAADLNWIEDFSIDKYRPMQRLLLDDDLEFLRRQPGYRPYMADQLRRERCRVFRTYLGALRRDFDRIYFAAKEAVLHSPEGVDLCGALARHRAVFLYAMACVQLRLVMYRFGWSHVDVSALIGALDEIMTDVRALRPVLRGVA